MSADNLNITEPYIGADERQDNVPASAPAGCRNRGVQKPRRHKPGPKRKNWMPNPYGKYPTASAVKKYIEATSQYYAPSTQAERSRKIRYLANIMRELGAPKTPSKWEEKHIRAFVKYLNDKKLDNWTRRKYIRFMNDFLEYMNNPALSEMLKHKQIRMPPIPDKDIRSLPEDVIQRIHNHTLTMEGWEGSVARLITVLYPYTGLRPSELRTLKYTDIDMANYLIKVSHPKGEGSYGKNRIIGILPQIRNDIFQFIVEREQYLNDIGAPTTSEPFIPWRTRQGKVSYWQHQKVLVLKRKIEQISGISFKLKDYRSSFCQIMIDRGAELQAVSKLMGHKNTRTTENYYGRIRDNQAIVEMYRVFGADTKNLIDPVLRKSQTMNSGPGRI